MAPAENSPANPREAEVLGIGVGCDHRNALCALLTGGDLKLTKAGWVVILLGEEMPEHQDRGPVIQWPGPAAVT
eukprot:COSAG02_NODE_303_length_25213_cov_126.386199_8_plen_74_part_00